MRKPIVVVMAVLAIGLFLFSACGEPISIRGEWSSPAVGEGVVYFGSEDEALYAVDIQTGAEKWKFETEGDVLSSPTIGDGVIYFGSQDGNLYAVDTQTRRLKWKFMTQDDISRSDPAIADGVV